MYIIIGFLLLSLIVIVHEGGHYLAARALGVGVVEFSLGMGPTLLHKRIGETVYSLRLFPLGGFCAMYGELSMEAEGKGDGGNGGKKKRTPDFKTDWSPDRALSRRPKWQQIIVVLAGPFFNVLLAFLASVILVSLPGESYGRPVIIGLDEGNPIAIEAGLEIDDVILQVDNRKMITSSDFTGYTMTHPKAEQNGYTVSVYRPATDENLQFFVVPNPDTGLIGITIQGEELSGLGGRLYCVYGEMRYWTLVVTDSLGMLFRGDAKITDMSGFVGITTSMGDAMETAADPELSEEDAGPAEFRMVRTALNIVIFISINLGVMNMIPIPALDGGRALVAFIEMFSRRSVPDKVIYAVNLVSMSGLLLLMGFLTIMDGMRIAGLM